MERMGVITSVVRSNYLELLVEIEFFSMILMYIYVLADNKNVLTLASLWAPVVAVSIFFPSYGLLGNEIIQLSFTTERCVMLGYNVGFCFLYFFNVPDLSYGYSHMVHSLISHNWWCNGCKVSVRRGIYIFSIAANFLSSYAYILLFCMYYLQYAH